MAFDFPFTGKPLYPKQPVFEFIPSIRQFAYNLVVDDPSLNDISWLLSYQYPLRNTYFVMRNLNWDANTPLTLYKGGAFQQYPFNVQQGESFKQMPHYAVLYIELAPVSTLLSSYPNSVYNLKFNPKNKSYVRDDITPYTEWYYIKNSIWYNNSDNGAYNDFNPRTPLSEPTNRYDVVLPFHLRKWGRWLNYIQTVDVDTTATINFLGCFRTSPLRYSRTFYPYFMETTLSEGAAFGRTIEYQQKDETYYNCTAVESIDKIREFCEMWGVDVVFTIKDAETYNIPTRGQPDNPNPDDAPQGNGDNSTDDIKFPEVVSIPTALYRNLWIDRTNVVNFREFLFSESFVNDIRRIWLDPAEAVVSLTYYPLDPQWINNIPLGESGTSLKISNLETPTVTGIPMLDRQTGAPMYIDMGSYTIEPYFGRYLDYDGYTDINIYMPYIGERKLDTSEIMDKTLRLIYYPDFVGNSFLAVVYANGQPIAEYTGSFGITIPLSGTAFNDFYRDLALGAMNTVIDIGGSFVGQDNEKSGAIGAANAAVSGIIKTATTQMHTKQIGSITPNVGIYAPQKPYIVISRPYMSRPAAWETLHGNSAGYSTTVGECTGYIEADEVRLLSNEIMTAEEQNEIENLLKGGIYA